MNLETTKRRRGRPPNSINEGRTVPIPKDIIASIPSDTDTDTSSSPSLSPMEVEDQAIIQANHNFRYNQLPQRYRRAYLQTEHSTNYLSLRSDIAFTVAVLTDLISRLDDPILSDDLISHIHALADHAMHTDAFKSPTKANRLLKDATKLADLTNQIEQQSASLKEIRIMQKHLILLVETERKRLEAGHNSMLMEDVFQIIQKGTNSIKRNAAQYIEDPQQRLEFLKAVADDYDRELALLGYTKTPIPEFVDPPTRSPNEPTRPVLKFSEEPLDPDDIHPEDILRHATPVIDEYFK